MAFGRSGAGAPMRTKSGRLRSTVYGNPEIRYQTVGQHKTGVSLINLKRKSEAKRGRNEEDKVS